MYPNSDIMFPIVKRNANFEVFPKKNPTREPIDRNCITNPNTKQIPNPIRRSLKESEGKQLSF